MFRQIPTVLLLAALAGGAYLYFNYEIYVQRGADEKVQSVTIKPRADSPTSSSPGLPPSQPPAKPLRPAIRIATFNLARLDEKKLANHRVSDILVGVIPQFDVVAVQNIRARNHGVLVRLLERINTEGRHYDFAVCGDLRSDAVEQYSAFLFDKASIEIDRSTVQWVEDSGDRFRYRPLVALFRVRGPDPAEAFTFKLVNVHTDPIQATAEQDLLDDVFRAARDSEPGEDDIILLGDFGSPNGHLGLATGVLDLTPTITGTPTTIRGIRPVDNILFDRRATAEFTGRARVLDLMRAYDLTMRGALEVSDHMPIWAEFSTLEGGQTGRVAQETPQTTRR